MRRLVALIEQVFVHRSPMRRCQRFQFTLCWFKDRDGRNIPGRHHKESWRVIRFCIYPLKLRRIQEAQLNSTILLQFLDGTDESIIGIS